MKELTLSVVAVVVDEDDDYDDDDDDQLIIKTEVTSYYCTFNKLALIYLRHVRLVH